VISVPAVSTAPTPFWVVSEETMSFPVVLALPIPSFADLSTFESKYMSSEVSSGPVPEVPDPEVPDPEVPDSEVPVGIALIRSDSSKGSLDIIYYRYNIYRYI